jgi:hypothetical protein
VLLSQYKKVSYKSEVPKFTKCYNIKDSVHVEIFLSFFTLKHYSISSIYLSH